MQHYTSGGMEIRIQPLWGQRLQALHRGQFDVDAQPVGIELKFQTKKTHEVIVATA